MADFKVRGRIFEVDEGTLTDLMNEWEIHRGDAIRMYFEEMGIIELGTGEELIEVIPQRPKRKYNKSDKPRKPTTRERKVDEDKLTLITHIEKAISELAELEARTNETDLHFSFNGSDYSVKLTKHRPKKIKKLAERA